MQHGSGECRQAADAGMPELDGTQRRRTTREERSPRSRCRSPAQAADQPCTNNGATETLELVFTLYSWFLAVGSEVM